MRASSGRVPASCAARHQLGHVQEVHRVVGVLLVTPQPVAPPVVQDRDVRCRVMRTVARILHRVVDLGDHPPAVGVDHRPVRRKRGHPVAGERAHRADHPLTDRVAALETAVCVLVVAGVLGEPVREQTPVAGPPRIRGSLLVQRERILEFAVTPAHRQLHPRLRAPRHRRMFRHDLRHYRTARPGRVGPVLHGGSACVRRRPRGGDPLG